MLIQVDWYKKTGKWAYGTRTEVTAPAFEASVVLLEIIESQQEIVKGWENSHEYYVVTSDISESENDPNYRTTYSRLYTPRRIEEILRDEE